MDLLKQKCVPCEGGIKPFSREKAEEMLKEIPGWELSEDGKSISKKYRFRDFKEALAFIDKAGKIAEEEGHHPDMHLTQYKFVTVGLYTHAINGLSQNDFILAAKIDAQV